MGREAVLQGEYGAKNGTVASHRWLGGNTAVPFYYHYDEQLQKTTDFLQNQTLNVDIFALKKLDTGELIAPLGLKAFHLEPNQDAQVFIVIQNKGLGHSLIPEQRDMYESWVEFTVKDADGREISHSGFLKPDGNLDEQAHSFTNRLVGASGKLLVQHEIWSRRAVAIDNTIQSGRSTLVRYQFHVPENAKSPLIVTARVNYRHFMQSFTDYILGPGQPPYPIVEMALQTRSISIGENQPIPTDLQGNSEWMRWNNYGIGLVDQQQFGDAVGAFEQVISLRPDYADAYTNLALANLGWQKFSLALDFVNKALDLSPGNARALYYRGLIGRDRPNGLPASIADLQLVAAQFPNSRDVCRELAQDYFLAHQDARARQMFESLQSTAPDDLLAHYYLAVLYTRAGLVSQAAEQASLYEQKKPDSGEGQISLTFLRSHPEIRDEYIPGHLHSDSNGRPNQK